MEREMQRRRGKMCTVPPGSAEEEQALAMMGSEGASPLGVGACISRTRPPVTPTRAVTSKSDVLLRQPPDLAEVLAKFGYTS